jgi:hypothetical protein
LLVTEWVYLGPILCSGPLFVRYCVVGSLNATSRIVWHQIRFSKGQGSTGS